MKKILVLITLSVVTFISAEQAVSAESAGHAEFGNVLNDTVSKYGVFDGENGVIYASEESFYYGRDMLLICSINDKMLNASVYGINDGIECIDTLSLPKPDNARFSVIIYDGVSYLLLDKKEGGDEYFAVLDDNFTHVPEITYSSKTDIIEFKNGKADTLQNTDQTLYNFLNSFRLETIQSYPYMNKVNVISGEMRNNLKKFLTSCSALTEFDRSSYDYDRLFKYVLYTHTAFSDIVSINPHSSLDGDIKSVSSEYIDYIMTEILGVTPEHPGATDLTDRGFCYRDGVYLYTGGFSADYETEILEFAAVHDLGGESYHIVFSDIYRENGKTVPEYSYAVVAYSDGKFSLIRLGMGKNLLTSKQISRYMTVPGASTPAWEKSGDETVPQKDKSIIIAISMAAAAVALIAVAVVLLIVRRKQKDE